MDKKPYPAEKARGGEIILNTPARRAIFLTGLKGAGTSGPLLRALRLGAVVLAVILMTVR